MNSAVVDGTMSHLRASESKPLVSRLSASIHTRACQWAVFLLVSVLMFSCMLPPTSAIELEICGYGHGTMVPDHDTDAEDEGLFYWNRDNCDSVELVVGEAAPPPGPWATDEYGFPLSIPPPRASVAVFLELVRLSSFDPDEATLVVEGTWPAANDALRIVDSWYDRWTEGFCEDPKSGCEFSVEIEGVSDLLRKSGKLEVIFDYYDTDVSNDLGWPDEIPLQISRFDLSGPDVFLLGDLNGDNVRDGFDIDPFVFLLTNGLAGYEEQFPAHPDPLLVADLTRDGALDGFDVSPFVELLTRSAVSAGQLSAVKAPEPRTWILAGALCACLVVFRSKTRKCYIALHHVGLSARQAASLLLLSAMLFWCTSMSVVAVEVDLEICGYASGNPENNMNSDGDPFFWWSRDNLDSVDLVVGDAAPDVGMPFETVKGSGTPTASVAVQLGLTGVASFDPAAAGLIIEGSWQPIQFADSDYITVRGVNAPSSVDVPTCIYDEDIGMCVWNPDITMEIEDVSDFVLGGKLELVFDYYDTDFSNGLGLPGDIPFQVTRFALKSEALVLLGDVNGDGSRDGFDIDPFVFLLTNGLAGYEEQFPAHPDPLLVADLTRDGALDGFDVNPFVELLTGAGVPAGELSTVAIPEPSTWVLIAVMCSCLALVSYRAV